MQAHEKMSKLQPTGKLSRVHPQPFKDIKLQSSLEKLTQNSERLKTFNQDGTIRHK